MWHKVTSYKTTEETSKCSFHIPYYNKPVLHDCSWKTQLWSRYERPELQEFRDLQNICTYNWSYHLPWYLNTAVTWTSHRPRKFITWAQRLYLSLHPPLIKHIPVMKYHLPWRGSVSIKPLNAELNPIWHLLALLGAHHILNFSRIRANVPNNCRHCSRTSSSSSSSSDRGSVTISGLFHQ
jgi:hypothetical protein